MYNSSIDSGRLIYLSFWGKVAILVLLGFGFILGVFVSISFVGVPEKTDWIIISITSAQLFATGLIAAVVFLFSESDANINSLEQRSDDFLAVHVRNALGRITAPGTDASSLKVDNIGKKDIFGNLFVLRGKNHFELKIWVGLNVHRVFVIYFVNADGATDNFVDELREIFKYTFGGAEKIGFHTFYERCRCGDEEIVSIWTSSTTKEDFLTSPRDKLFWAQDIAMMTQSYLRTALRNSKKIKIATVCDPGPL